ncbi:MAG: AAA domain-containing protein [Acidimicrobiales bacterium]
MPAAFDLVILDEASMIDQGSAAGALLRAQRAVIIGDPRQLRFVSFVADDDVDAAVARHGCQPLADKVDVRRASTYDLAAAVAPVTFLDEHFRSVPHLIGFSAHRFYEDRLQVTTRHPLNDGVPAIEVVPVAGERTKGGTNQAEIDEAVARVAALLEQDGATTIGVISPHRPQVDALRSAIAAAVAPEHWERGRIRVATVHGFQGSECDIVIASFGISGDGGRTRHFLEDPNLFNVLITRARRRMIVLTSVADVPPGLLADYLRWAEHPPPIPRTSAPPTTGTAPSPASSQTRTCPCGPATRSARGPSTSWSATAETPSPSPPASTPTAPTATSSATSPSIGPAGARPRRSPSPRTAPPPASPWTSLPASATSSCRAHRRPPVRSTCEARGAAPSPCTPRWCRT